jgi:hypothetical protein
MSKLLTLIVAAMFAVVSGSSFAASHVGAQMKDDTKKSDKKMEKKAKSDKKKASKKKSDKMDKMDKSDKK